MHACMQWIFHANRTLVFTLGLGQQQQHDALGGFAETDASHPNLRLSGVRFQESV